LSLNFCRESFYPEPSIYATFLNILYYYHRSSLFFGADKFKNLIEA
jgi:hypothetical protein